MPCSNGPVEPLLCPAVAVFVPSGSPPEPGDNPSPWLPILPMEPWPMPPPSSCPLYPLPPSPGQGHHSRAQQLKPFSLHSLLIFLYFWLCFRSKILFAVHHLASLAPGQHARLLTRALTKVRSSSDPRPSCRIREGARAVLRGCRGAIGSAGCVISYM